MSEFNNRELIEAIYDVRDRVTRIEEKLNRTEGLSDKVDNAEERATEALLKSRENQRDIEILRTNNRWAWGFVLTLVVGVVAKILFEA